MSQVARLLAVAHCFAIPEFLCLAHANKRFALPNRICGVNHEWRSEATVLNGVKLSSQFLGET